MFKPIQTWFASIWHIYGLPLVIYFASYMNTQLKPITEPLFERSEGLKHQAQAKLDEAILRLSYYLTLTFKLWLLFVTLLIILCTAFFWAFVHYSLLYYWFMPTMQERVPVYLDFSTGEPHALTPLLDKQWTYSSFSQSQALTTHDRNTFLYGGQHYDVSLEFVLPDSPATLDLRMFNVQLDLYHTAAELPAPSPWQATSNQPIPTSSSPSPSSPLSPDHMNVNSNNSPEQTIHFFETNEPDQDNNENQITPPPTQSATPVPSHQPQQQSPTPHPSVLHPHHVSADGMYL